MDRSSDVLTLALDTTTKAGSAAVLRGETVLALREGDGTRTHGERLPGELDAVLRAAGVKATDLDLLAVAAGPGAFTGLRIGLASIQGLALALGKPVVGVSALEALADACGPSARLVAAWMDAARGEVFAALYRSGAEIAPPAVGVPAEILARWREALDGSVLFVGDGALRYREVLEHHAVEIVPQVPLLAPSVGVLGLRLALAGAAGPPHALQPLYVRRPDAELARSQPPV